MSIAEEPEKSHATPVVAMVDDIEHVVPADLQEHGQWCLWRYVRRGNDETKVPCSITGRLAKANDPQTWASFDNALDANRTGDFAGIGFVFAADDPFVGVDLDDCLDDDGNPDDRARKIIDDFDTYTEVSPSGHGVKMFCRGDAIPKGKNVGWCELYSRGRFFTVTGNRLPGTPATINDCSKPFAALYASITKPATPSKGTGRLNGPAARTSNGTAKDNRFQRYMAYLKAMPTAVSRDGGHNRTYHAAREGFRFGCSAAEVTQGMEWFNSNKAEPPWSAHDLAHKLEDAEAESKADGDFGRRLTEDRPNFNGRKSVGVAKLNGTHVDADTGEIHTGHCDPDEVRLSEQGNAQRVAAAHGEDLMFLPQLGRWHVWSGSHWQPDALGQVVGHAKETAVDLEKLRGTAMSDPKAVERHIARSQSSAGISGVVKLLQTEPGIPALVDDLDTDPWALNVANGTIDLRTGTLRAHDRGDRITRCLPIDFNPDAKAPRWMQYLAEVQPDPSMPAYLSRVVGYAASGSISIQEVWCLWGSGANGKSIFHDTTMHVLGNYAGMAPPSLITASGRDEHPTELADLLGKRLVIATETEEDAKLKVQLVKRLSGDEMIKARRMRQDYFEFRRTMKTWLITNNKPRVDEASNAIWRRLRLVPFNVTIPAASRDIHLLDKLKAEAEGILAWIVAGSVDLQCNGMQTPQIVQDATNEYRTESDRLADYRESQLATRDGLEITRADLFADYLSWAKSAGDHDHLGDRSFYARIRTIPGVVEGKWTDAGTGKTVRGFVGIDLAWKTGGAR